MTGEGSGILSGLGGEPCADTSALGHVGVVFVLLCRDRYWGA